MDPALLKERLAAQVEVGEPRARLVPFDAIKLSAARRDLIRRIIPRVGLTIVWGPPKSGKSFWTFDAMMHVALGWSYRGRRVHQGSVVYCAFEGQFGLEARVEAFRKRFLQEEHSAVPFFLEPVTLDLVRDHAELIAVIRRQLTDPPVAVVLDTLNRSLQGSESSDEDMTAYIRAADAIWKAFECAVVIVHHCGVDGSRPRGHTALTGTCDGQIAVKRGAADNIVVTVELLKDGPQGDVILNRLEVVDVGLDEDGETISSCVVTPVDGKPTAKAKPRKAAKLTPGTQIIVNAVDYLMAHTEAILAPPIDGVAAGTRAVRLEDVRDWAMQTGLGRDDPKSAAARKRWFDGKAKAIAEGVLAEHGGLLWRR